MTYLTDPLHCLATFSGLLQLSVEQQKVQQELNKVNFLRLTLFLSVELKQDAIFTMSISSGGQGAWPPWILKHGTNIVDRGLKGLFSAFLLFFGLFSVTPPERGK